MPETGQIKRIYFVRHGETEANVSESVPSKDEPLNAQGELQSVKLLERVKHIDFEKMYSSDFKRAKDTARAIAEVKNKPLQIHSAFGEMLEPSRFFGVSEKDEQVQKWRKERNENIVNSSWRFEDGETYSDVFSRISTAKKLIEDDTASNILVATHSWFMQLFTAAILLNADKPNETWYRLAKVPKMSNTGVTLFTIENGKWRLVMWNDHAHFAEN